jgi:hypothetical protein
MGCRTGCVLVACSFGGPGPLDLPPDPAAAATPRIASIKEALEADSRLFCCD